MPLSAIVRVIKGSQVFSDIMLFLAGLVLHNIPGVFQANDRFEYPVSFNGKTRFKLEFPLDMPTSEIEKAVLANENSAKFIEGKPIKKIIVVQGKIINVVV